MQAKLDAADQAKYGLEERIVAAELNSKTLESEVEQLRAALVQEVQSAESEVQRRQDEEAEIREKLSQAVKRSKEKKIALFGQAYETGIDKSFVKSLGTMVDTIESAEAACHQQEICSLI